LNPNPQFLNHKPLILNPNSYPYILNPKLFNPKPLTLKLKTFYPKS